MLENSLPEIQTPRLFLRISQSLDAAAEATYFTANYDHLKPWAPVNENYCDAAAWVGPLQRASERAREGTDFRFGIFLTQDRAKLIGHVNLIHIVRGNFLAAVLGYDLSAAAQGCGYMTEAAGAAVRFAFDDLRLHRIMANYQPENVRSAAVLQRLGFAIEGSAKQYLFVDGQWRDHVLTSLTNGSVEP